LTLIEKERAQIIQPNQLEQIFKGWFEKNATDTPLCILKIEVKDSNDRLVWKNRRIDFFVSSAIENLNTTI
jgi:hypothetical protein